LASRIGEKDLEKSDQRARLGEVADEESDLEKKEKIKVKELPGEDSEHQRFVSYEEVKRRKEEEPAQPDEMGRIRSF